MNTISAGFQKDAEDILMNKVIGNPEIKAVVFMSSKSDNFIAGADIDMVYSHILIWSDLINNICI